MPSFFLNLPPLYTSTLMCISVITIFYCQSMYNIYYIWLSFIELSEYIHSKNVLHSNIRKYQKRTCWCIISYHILVRADGKLQRERDKNNKKENRNTELPKCRNIEILKYRNTEKQKTTEKNENRTQQKKENRK